jgi:hypothetical protein
MANHHFIEQCLDKMFCNQDIENIDYLTNLCKQRLTSRTGLQSRDGSGYSNDWNKLSAVISSLQLQIIQLKSQIEKIQCK